MRIILSNNKCFDWVSLTQQQFRRSVPQCDDPVCVAVPLTVLSQTKRSGQSKISQLQNAILGDQNIGCFHVSVEDLTQTHKILQSETLNITVTNLSLFLSHTHIHIK